MPVSGSSNGSSRRLSHSASGNSVSLWRMHTNSVSAIRQARLSVAMTDWLVGLRAKSNGYGYS